MEGYVLSDEESAEVTTYMVWTAGELTDAWRAGLFRDGDELLDESGVRMYRALLEQGFRPHRRLIVTEAVRYFTSFTGDDLVEAVDTVLKHKGVEGCR